ncbi:ATP-dependent DNA ligase [Paramicrobacterium humi]|uniref:DNA ligase (ATP) n=1 Tax=Paramicrobacterium humi TaxID=640635 RepID=A0A1H4J913_9MICO|nr:ATP-dependent DNA ligase [Microbacterium humi]SEB42763.1 ATP-dependent DNA ligase [Microbacterium humi]
MQPTAESPVAPMLARAVDAVPEPDSVEGGLAYEPKWDGFRGIAYVDGPRCEIGSRGSKPLTRYFPELVAALTEQLRVPCVLDGEIVVRTGTPGHEHLDWEALSQRIHPAATRIEKLSQETPAMFVAFDLLALGDRDYLSAPFRERRAALESLAAELRHPLSITRLTTDVELARRWLVEFEGAGLDGVVAKRLAEPYAPGKRQMLKVKHHRTADVVALGYRLTSDGTGLASLLLGLFDDDGVLRNVGAVSAFTDKRRRQLVDELAPHVDRDAAGMPLKGETERSRFSSGKDLSYVRLKPEVVLEVRYDQLEGARFRHTAQFERWRPDREARSCTFEQLERPIAYDLSKVIS